jgi:hypothetical protein
VHERGWIELAHAPDIAWEPLPAEGWPFGAQAKVLSRDPADGAFSGVVRLEAGYRRPAGHVTADIEVFILSGTLRLGDSVKGLGWYGFLPAGVSSRGWTAESDVELLLFARTGAPHFKPEPGPVTDTSGIIAIDTEAVEWTASSRDGIAPGLSHKLLRFNPETGEAAILGAAVPTWDSPYLEFHHTIEEIYCVSGDISLGNAGRMDAGSYLWRPPFITHGPFWSEAGAIIFIWVDGHLVNHPPERPDSTPEENRRAFERDGAPAITVPFRTGTTAAAEPRS